MLLAVCAAKATYTNCYTSESYIEYIPNLKYATLYLVKGSGANYPDCNKFPLGIDVYLTIITPGQAADLVDATFDNYSYNATQTLYFSNIVLADTISLIMVEIFTYAETTSFQVSQLLSVEFSVANCFAKGHILIEYGYMTFTSQPTGLCTSQLTDTAPNGLELVELQLEEQLITIDDATFISDIRSKYENASSGQSLSVVHTSSIYASFYTTQLDTAVMRFSCKVNGQEVKAQITVDVDKYHKLLKSAIAWHNSSSLTLLMERSSTAIPANIDKVAFSILLYDDEIGDSITLVHFLTQFDRRYITTYCTGSQAEIEHCYKFLKNTHNPEFFEIDVGIKLYSGLTIVQFERIEAKHLSGYFSRAIMSLYKGNICANLRYDVLFDADQLMNFTVRYYSPLLSEAAKDGKIESKQNITRELDFICFECNDDCVSAYNSDYMFDLQYASSGLFSLEKEAVSYLVVYIISFLLGGIIIALALAYAIIGVIYMQQRLKAAKKKKLK